MVKYIPHARLLCAGTMLTVLLAGASANAQLVEPPYDSHYAVIDLGSVPELPSPNGGLTFLRGDPDTLIIGGSANDPGGMLYRVRVARDVDGHVVGFSGSASVFAEAPYNDGGVNYGPADVLFLTRFPTNELGQIPAGSTSTARIVDLAAVGVVESPGGLSFVPAGFPGEGTLKLASWGDGGFYTLQLSSMESGTFDVLAANRETSIPGGPEGFVYIPAGSPMFADNDEMLVSDWSENSISVYNIDDAGNPVPNTRRLFVTDVNGPEGAAIDPLTGDFFFSTFAPGNDRVIVVRGFAAPPPEDPPHGECDNPRPKGPGYWHRQCLGMDTTQEGIDPGRGNGPQQPTEPTFIDELVPCVDRKLAELGLSEDSTCDGMELEPASSSYEHAVRWLTTLALNVCANLVQESCEISLPHLGCTSTSIGGLMEEASSLIQLGNDPRASMCLKGVNER